MGIYVEDYTESVRLVDSHHRMGKRVVLARGTFDLFHLGHIDFLERAKDLGDVLLVNVNNDEWVKERKGEGRPFRSQEKRAGLIAKQEMVDYVFVHPGQAPTPRYQIHPAVALAILSKPDVVVRENKNPEFQELERQIFSDNSYYPDYRVLARSDYDESTSDIISKMKEYLRPEVSVDLIEETLQKLLSEAKGKRSGFPADIGFV